MSDSQNFSEEMNLVAEDAGRKELETSITDTTLDGGETLSDNLEMKEDILDTDKNVSDALQQPSIIHSLFSQIVEAKEAGVTTKTEEVTEAIG